jgi:hypothetical protein
VPPKWTLSLSRTPVPQQQLAVTASTC